MNSGTTELTWEGEIPLAQVLEYCTPAYGETWQKVADTLQSDPIENAIVDTLINESMETGLFEEPIFIYVDKPHAKSDCEDPEDHATYCVDEGGSTRYSLGNGTHRVVAAMTAAYPTIRATAQSLPHEEVGILVAKFNAEGGNFQCVDCDDPVECFAFCVLRSFRLLPGVWADMGCGSGGDGKWSAVYELPEEYLMALDEKIVDLAAQYGITLKNLKVTYEKEEDE